MNGKLSFTRLMKDKTPGHERQTVFHRVDEGQNVGPETKELSRYSPQSDKAAGPGPKAASPAAKSFFIMILLCLTYIFTKSLK
ncbi:hypothetical protein QQ991_14250 [Weizmannia coagulans]|uniref:Uncharacterized protein n=2 Tax=Bacillaceae TaxID=186817 RepID=A0ABV3NMN6_9BACI|nr:hypothetical protein [Heyndrickxia coagulans]KGB29025.1 hypothetical protein IE89_13735 [Heyndrickxia coagulans]KXT20328.1 hypothetical protein UZ35_10225 [Heyndrickxia coagulans]MBT2196233.1 hypothetical protein [Heyndrickxia coagulans]MBT2238544.1 hypothetical protein [Heyndrickxia coagulans]MCR4446484.1 hypothetical protein [Heyndrickxia coagulans]